MKNFKLQWHKWINWEYWPMPVVYYPIMPVWFFLALRAKSFFFFNAANPTIKNGGMAMESKKEIYDIMPTASIPKTIYFKSNHCVEEILRTAALHQIQFPFIVKPDVGMKGLAVQIIKNKNELVSYLKRSTYPLLVQELVAYKNEVGIFYCRMPGESIGKITGIVHKKMLSVTGNGNDTMLQLVKKNPRSFYQLKALKKMYGDQLQTILPAGEKFVLVPYGSHTRGAEFTDYTYKLNKRLQQTIDHLCKNIDGFYYGRLDIRYACWEDFSNGKNFKVIELNGAGSEPTHIYDPSHSLLFAWKEIIRHWILLYKVSRMNYEKGYTYLSFAEGRIMLNENSLLEKKLKAF